MRKAHWLPAATVCLVLAGSAQVARAQAQGFAVDTFEPSERGSDWFSVESLDLRGNVRPAIGVVMDGAYRPLVIDARRQGRREHRQKPDLRERGRHPRALESPPVRIQPCRSPSFRTAHQESSTA